MFGRCKHEWEETGRSVTPGVDSIQTGGFKGSRMAYEQHMASVRRLVDGETHVALRCKHCGDVATRTLRGEHP